MKKVALFICALFLFPFLFPHNVSAENDLKAAALRKLQHAVVKAIPTESGIIRLAVLDLEGDDGTVRNAITNAITEKTAFRVIERADLDKILAEQGLQLKDIMDEKTRIQPGRIRGVQAVMFGKVGGMEKGFMSHTVKVHLKLVDVEKGDILFSKDFDTTTYSPYRKWLLYGLIALLGLIALKWFIIPSRRSHLIETDTSLRVDLAKEVDKALANVSAVRSKLNSEGKQDKGVFFSDIESDLLHLKQVVQLAPRENVLKKGLGDHDNVNDFDRNVMSSFKLLTKSSKTLYETVVSGSPMDHRNEADLLKKDIHNLLNLYSERGF